MGRRKNYQEWKESLVMDKTKEDTVERICSDYRKQIFDMISKIENKKFLKRIYISLREYLDKSE